MKEEISVLFEDNHIIVCVKPGGILSQSGRDASPDMVNLLKGRLYEKNAGGQTPYLAPVHRLDRPVGGVMVFAKSPFAAKDLSRQAGEGKMGKKYMAVTCGRFDTPREDSAAQTVLTDYLIKDPRTNLSRIALPDEPGAKKAVLGYRLLSVITEGDSPLALLEVELLTGRHHQIRVQLSAHGHPIWGDQKYNPAFRDSGGRHSPALYAYSLSFYHPKTKKRLCFKHSPEDEIFSKFTGFYSHEPSCI